MKNFYQEFKTPIVTIVLLFLALFLYTKLAGPIPFFINSVTTTKTDLFSSSGEGEVTAIPDTGLIYVGVTQTSANVSDAKNKTNAIAEKIIKDIKALGISNKDIKTTNYSVNPNYGSGPVPLGTETQAQMYPVPDSGRNQIISYTVTQNLEVKVKPLDKVNKVIDLVTSDGANLVGGVSFTFSDDLQKSLENKARVEAVADAKTKAQNLANAAGLRLGRIVNVVESSNQPRPIMLGTAAEKTDQSQPATNVTPGENAVTVNVVIYYETY